MATLSIKNVPDSLLAKLRERAALNHRSLQGELMALLYVAVESPSSGTDVPASRQSLRGRRTGTRQIEEIAAEHRKRWKKPINRGPSATEIIRAERDAR